MPSDVAVWRIAGHHRSSVICTAAAKGLRAASDRVYDVDESTYREPLGDAAVFYGLEGKLPRIFDEYRAAGRPAVYVDLGYWGRRAGGRWTGYHKLSVNDRHPTAYFQRRRHDDSRARELGVRLSPWTRGRHIVLAGMGDKGARAEGFEPEQWERAAIAEIRRHTDRPIIYRPKPSWKLARPIPGTAYSPKAQDVSDILRGAHAVVTHHSNVAVDGLVAGVPCFVWGGVAAVLGSQSLAEIETPRRPPGREQWVADIAWQQWSVAELGTAAPWRHLKDEGLLP